MRIWNTLHPTAENNPSSDDDEQQDYNLDAGDHVHASDTPFWKESVEQSDEDNDTNCDTTFGPFGDGDSGGCEDVLREHDTTGCYSNSQQLEV
jgi:hypothetical protein